MAATPLSFADAEKLTGHTDVTGWLTVDAAHLAAFSHASYLDPADVDLTTSRNHALGPELVDGFLLLSLLVHFDFADPVLDTAGGRYGFNYGLDRVRFTAPVFAGERVRLRRTVADVRAKSPTRYRITLDVEMEKEGGDRPVMLARWLLLSVLGDAERAGTAG